jgi:hypothetical protein
MTLKQRINAFVQLGNFLNRHFEDKPQASELLLHEGLNKLIELVPAHNPWFTPVNIKEALQGIAFMLDEESLNDFAGTIPEREPKRVAVVCAGNIPLVCFHDILCVLLSGHKILIKMSGDDNLLLPFFLKLLVHYEPDFESSLRFAEGKLSDFDAVIATGSNNTAKHFEFYFGKYPNIIRRNRTSVAVLDGNESNEDLKQLGKDIFSYFGLGCRNVGKLLVPAGYSFNRFFENIHSYGDVVMNNKYGSNYDYHRSLYLLESIPFLDNNFLILRQSGDLHSPVSVLYYEEFNNKEAIKAYLKEHREQLQCIVGKEYTPFGCSQRPVITEFADHVNTLEFLVHL